MQYLPTEFHDETPSRSWHGRWIGPASDAADESRALFRREFTVHDPAGCRLFISAERDYQLFVNGRFVCRGVPPSPFYYKFYDTVDLADRLVAGTNLIAVLVSQIGAPQTGLLIDLEDADGRLMLKTDDSWRVTARTGWCAAGRDGVKNTQFQEIFDANLQPSEWTTCGFDAGNWDRPCVYPPVGNRACPWKRMVARETPFPAEWDVLPNAVTAVREGLDIQSRGPVDPRSAVLSAPGRALHHARIDNGEALLQAEGETVLQCSTKHHTEPAFDGIYAPSVVLDFGTVITGYLTLELDGAAAGRLDVGYVERLLDGEFNNAIEVPYADRYVLKDGRQRLQSTIWKGFRYVKLRLSGTDAPVKLSSVKVRICTYPYAEQGGFEASDELLSQVFNICRYTIRLCSRDFLMDTPWRERNQWLGDNSAVTLPGIYACFGDTALPRQFLQQACATPTPLGLLVNNSQTHNALAYPMHLGLGNPIPDYSLYWIQAVLEYYRYTGDTALVRAAYPHVVNILHYHFRHLNEFGLVSDLPVWVFIDHVFHPPCGTVAAYNAIWYGTLGDAAALAEMIGDRGTFEKTRECRQMLEANFSEAFYDAKTGCFRDGFADGEPTGDISEHSNLAAIRWGLASEAETASIIGHFYDKKDVDYLEAEPFYCHIVLPALRQAGRMDLALDLIRNRWGERMVKVGMTSTTEEWHASGSRRGQNGAIIGMYNSLSHAWSASPAEFLIRQMAGFDIIEPGCAKVRLNPFPADFDYRATIPTPRGNVTVHCRAGKLTIDCPDQIELL